MKKNKSNIRSDKECIESIRKGDEDAFKQLFLKYYAPLCSIAADFIGSFDIGKEVVQDVFLQILESRDKWNPPGPLKPYLYRSVCNRAINYIKQDKSRREAMARYHVHLSNENIHENEDNYIDERSEELNRSVWEAIKKLPKRRYLIVVMHKVHGLSYKEIADSMDISVKTVENQMGRAMKSLRNELSGKAGKIK